MSPAPAWWEGAVVYEVYVRSFADGDGDGVGDLRGVRQRLGHLADLGVDALWLTPFYRSPMVDGGYDVADHCDVDPLFGTLADLDGVVADAHALGLRVLVDIVPNHTSSAHPWFVAALDSQPGSAARARYLFRDGRGEGGAEPPNNWQSDFGGPAWTRLPGDGQWYLHLFDREQPDLDWTNPEVADEMDRILRFWLDRGVDGFRIDVAHGMAKHPGLPDNPPVPPPPPGVYRPVGHQWDQPAVHDIHRRLRRVLDGYGPDRMAVGEAWATTPEALARYVRPDELHQSFNFFFLQAGWEAGALREAIGTSFAAMGDGPALPTWVLGNHDVRRPATRFGGGDPGRRRALAAALLMLALPGAAYIYQGEELALPEVELPDDALRDPTWRRSGHTRRGRDGCRVPVPWARGPAGRFGFCPPEAEPWLPMPPGWGDLSVEAQLQDPGSALALFRAALQIRRQRVAAARTAPRWLPSPPGTLALHSGDLVSVTNLSAQPVHLPQAAGTVLLASAAGPAGQVAAEATAWCAPS